MPPGKEERKMIEYLKCCYFTYRSSRFILEVEELGVRPQKDGYYRYPLKFWHVRFSKECLLDLFFNHGFTAENILDEARGFKSRPASF